MRLFWALFILCCALVFGQTAPEDKNLAALGVSYQPGGSPALAGTGLYARQLIASSGTYAFTAMDGIPEAGVKPFTVTTGTAVGVAQRILTIGAIGIYVPLAAGFSYTGTNTGWVWTTGALAVIPVGATSWRVMPDFRAVKSSVGSQQGYSVIAGVLFGWGW